MSHPVIRCENLGKHYALHHPGARPGYRTLREDLLHLPARFMAAWRGRNPTEEFWALRNVSFAVRQGEVLGIIGRNGAGKSTLLKILSRITAPSEGGVDLSGRVGSLLEVGTGFHPELTGRENIFLSGAMLGMRRNEVRTHFDEIVAFAEVEQFLDTPCKHYSSGMYTRLGFAVAAHLKTDILLVDEVLAVGDASFQQRCLGKMAEVAGGGRTVLLVSHNLAAVRQLCSRGLVLGKGRVVYCGEIESAVAAYQEQFSAAGIGVFERMDRPAGPAWIAAARIMGRGDRVVGCLSMSDEIGLEVEIEASDRRRLAFSIQVREFGQSPLIHCPSADVGPLIPAEAGRHRLRVILPPVQLYPGVYGLRLALTEAAGGTFEVLDIVDDLSITVEQDPAVCARPLSRQAGVVYVRPRWEYHGRV